MKHSTISGSENEWEALLQYDLGGPVNAFNDTVFFGGSGTGDGSVVVGGMWTWETPNAAMGAPEFFPDGDPIGNQYRDGWTLMDRTARVGPSYNGAPHWKADGTYDFDYDATLDGPINPTLRPGGFAHGDPYQFGGNPNSDLGPDPLVEPGEGGAWSMWIGTNLFLNPENCSWGQKAGHGDGWSQGIKKTYVIPEGTPPGTQYDIRFFHRYAIEFDFDTCWTEISFDGSFWQQVGTAANPNGIFNDGCHLTGQCAPNGPLPSVTGGAEVVNLYIHTPPQPDQDINLHVRFRVATDAFYSDNNEGGDFFYAWDLDNIALIRNGLEAEPRATFETGWDGWQPASFEGFDFDLTASNQPAGRLELSSNLACPPIIDCPEACGLSNRILMFSDKDDCDLNDQFADSYAVSDPFFIAEGQLDGVEGRLFEADIYTDGGAGFFETGPTICWVYFPFNGNNCPYTPPANDPGAGGTYNWSQTNFVTCDFYGQGTGPDCVDNFLDDVSANLPADSDSVSLIIGAFSQCRSEAGCDINDNGAPFYDNMRFGVFDPAGISLTSDTSDRYSDNFPLSDPGGGQNISQMVARTDGGHSLSQNLGLENPGRWCRSDTAVTKTGAPDITIWMRFAVERGPCQTNLGDPWFTQYPPSAPLTFPGGLIWHTAQMDTANAHQTGATLPNNYMSCYHEDSPLEGTHWCGMPPSVEPCDDILSDCLYTPGTTVYYFFEVRDAAGVEALGSFPAGRLFAPIGTDPVYATKWLQLNNLPTVTDNCTGEYENNLLVVSSYQSNGVPGRGTTQRDRVTAVLSSLGLTFDVYDDAGTNFSDSYNGIGRREDRTGQQPRPPFNGATQAMLEGYDCIWNYTGLLGTLTLTDRFTLSFFGGQPSQDQQTLDTWLGGCTSGNERLLVLSGISWASDIDVNTFSGPSFLTGIGVDVLSSDYAQQQAANDLRRCARLAGQGPGAGWTGEILGSGCPDNLDIDVLAALGSGVPIANYVESFEDGEDPVNCADDANRTTWHAIIRQAAGAGSCERTVAMSFEFSELYPLNCVDQCLFNDWVVNGTNAELVIDIFQWANKPINANPIGIEDPAGSPRFVNELYNAQPNPANPAARIRYTIADKGLVSLKIFDVSGRLVRTLVNEVQEPTTEGFEVVWDGTNDTGQRVSTGVFFYQIDTPGFTSAKKLVILK
jgi:hypothetical protein